MFSQGGGRPGIAADGASAVGQDLTDTVIVALGPRTYSTIGVAKQLARAV